MDFYQSRGYLILGSRMRRLSEYFLNEVNRIYQTEKLDFEASWFPIFHLLSDSPGHQELSIRDISDQIQVSHSAVSQLITNLKKRELVQTRPSRGDGRVQLVRLAPKRLALLERVLPIWQTLQLAMEEMVCEDPQVAVILDGLTALETKFSEKGLSDRVAHYINVEKTLN